MGYIRNVLSVSGTLKYADSGTAWCHSGNIEQFFFRTNLKSPLSAKTLLHCLRVLRGTATNYRIQTESWHDPQQIDSIEADQHCHQQIQWLTCIYNANAVGRKQCICKHGCHINGVIKSSIDQEDEHINVVADDTGIFAFLWLWYSRLFGKG